MKPSVMAWLAGAMLACALSTATVVAADKAQEAASEISAAETALAEAASLDAVWMIWDKAVPAGEDAPGLEEMLEVAKQKEQAGDLDEALRLAKKVAFFARAGIEQAKVNEQTGVPKLR